MSAPTVLTDAVIWLGGYDLSAASNEVTFKQLIVEEGKQYLKTLNPDWPNRIIEVTTDTNICGVIIFKGEAL